MRTNPAPSALIPIVVLGALAAACSGQEPAPAAIEASDLAQRIRSDSAPLILDVRTPGEFASGHIPGALNIPYDQLGGRLSEIDAEPGDEIVVHCESGRRAEVAADLLREAGYPNVRDLTGHMRAWREAGLPVE